MSDLEGFWRGPGGGCFGGFEKKDLFFGVPAGSGGLAGSRRGPGGPGGVQEGSRDGLEGVWLGVWRRPEILDFQVPSVWGDLAPPGPVRPGDPENRRNRSGGPKTAQNHKKPVLDPHFGGPGSRITYHFWALSGPQAWAPGFGASGAIFPVFSCFSGPPGHLLRTGPDRGFGGVLGVSGGHGFRVSRRLSASLRLAPVLEGVWPPSWGCLGVSWRGPGTGSARKPSSAEATRNVARLQTQTFGRRFSPGERRGVFRAGGVPHERRAWPL